MPEVPARPGHRARGLRRLRGATTRRAGPGAALVCQAVHDNHHKPTTPIGVTMDPAIAEYVNAIPPEHRPLFDRIHRLILDTCPDATVVLSYKMPTYRPAPGGCTSGCGNTGCPCTGGKGRATAGSPPGTRTCRPAPAPSASARTPPQPSPTTTSATSPAPPSPRARAAVARHQILHRPDLPLPGGR